MKPVKSVTDVRAIKLSTPFPTMAPLFVSAVGEVPTTGWSSILLLPRFYVTPPSDGIWDFDFVGTPPGFGAMVISTVHANYFGHLPPWLKGVRVHAKDNSLEDIELKSHETRDLKILSEEFERLSGDAIVQKVIAVYDDSFQPIGFCGPFKVKMKKLRHELTLTIEGPDEGKINDCINQALGAGLLAGIIAAFASGGMAAASAFVSTAINALIACLGDGFSVRFDDRSHWIEWCT